MGTPEWSTADLCDDFGDAVQVVAPLLYDFGGRAQFSGEMVTVRVRDDNTLVRALLDTAGAARVLVVDGGGSTRCALLGDRLCALAVERGWAGVVVHGAVRDTAVLRGLPLGVRALAAVPKRSAKGGGGEEGISLAFGGATFTPGAWLYSDADGIALATRRLTA